MTVRCFMAPVLQGLILQEPVFCQNAKEFLGGGATRYSWQAQWVTQKSDWFTVESQVENFALYYTVRRQ